MSGRAMTKTRELLRAYPDGLSTPAIARQIGAPRATTLVMLHKMPDAYIHHWESNGFGDRAVWRVVVPPPHCERPRNKGRSELQPVMRPATSNQEGVAA